MSSPAMEQEGLRRALDELSDEGVTVLPGDRSAPWYHQNDGYVKSLPAYHPLF